MTSEEMERGIEFLLKSQGTLEAQLEQTSRQVEETNKRLEAFSETQTEFIQIVTRHIETQAEINGSLRGAVRELAEFKSETDARLSRLAETVERLIEGKS